MPKVRSPLRVIVHVTALQIPAWCAAAETSSEPPWHEGVFNSAYADDVVSSHDSGNSAYEVLQFEEETTAAPSNGPEENLPQIFEQGDPPSGTKLELPTEGGDESVIVNLNGESTPAYSFGYDGLRNATTWIPGDDDDFGWFSYESISGTKMGDMPSLVTGFGVHFLDGPVQTDMPPRLFDFSIGIADRRLLQPNIGYDIALRVGAFSDFEGSAKDGIRYPGHAVTFLRLSPCHELVLGIDYLDRDDIRMLPVVGSIWSPKDWLKIEAVFPRPRVAARIYESTTWIYVGGELGGGTWAIERVNLVDDNATYKDLRLVLGWETLVADLLSSAFEIGYVFDRELSYSSGVGDYDPSDGFMVRMTSQF